MKQVTKIVSGGQTGADRAGLDAAIAVGLVYGGWCPKGRKAEDGVIPANYELQETTSADYLRRTDWNARDSDGTVIFAMKPKLSGGTLKTVSFAEKHGRPLVVITPESLPSPSEALSAWLSDNRIGVLNVAGPRGSKEPLVHGFAFSVLTKVLAA